MLLDLAEEAEDEATAKEADGQIGLIRRSLADIEFRRMLSGELDGGGAIVQITAGAGGVDASDWAQMLMRMLLRYCDRKGWKTEILDEVPAEEAGIKSATFTVAGDFSYGLLKAENGVHRLVRISPFDAASRRHTAFALVEVSPVVQESGEVEIDDEDLQVDTYRASGAGGQHVNKTDSAVRITHVPTGIVVQCQNERSQTANKQTAMRMLRSRLAELQLEEREAEIARERGVAADTGFGGTNIRSYVLQPYQQVKDHRTGHEVGNAQGVLDGDIDGFIHSYLLAQASGEVV